MNICPFIHGRALRPEEFINRERALRYMLGRIATGQSTALVGPPHIGKTSFLKYLRDPDVRQKIVGDSLKYSLFSYIDSQMLGEQVEQAAFWQQALRPLAEGFTPPGVSAAYQTAKENDFGSFTLEQLLTRLGREGWQCVLILDEFDALLTHPTFNKAKFYGSLRSLSSRCAGLTTIIASRRSLEFLNQETQKLNPHSSPYFNIFAELRLGPLPRKHVIAMLRQGDGRFNSADCRFLADASGRHPYLLQTASAILWAVHDEGLSGAKRYRQAADELHLQLADHFRDTWNAWSAAEKKVVTTIALSQLEGRVAQHSFSWQDLLDHLHDYSGELRYLEKSGTLVKEGANTWRIAQEALLW